MALKTFILAAGLGTRLRPYTEHVPKPAIPFLGIPLVGYPMYLAHKAGVSEMVVNTHPFPDKIQNCVSQLNQNRFHIQFSHEDKEPMGSGGALFHAKDLLAGATDFFVINGDTVFIPKNENLLLDLYSVHQAAQSICTLVVSEDPMLVQQFNPIWVNPNNQLVGIGKTAPASNCRPVHYLGVKVFKDRIFEFVPAGITNLFQDILLPAIKKGEVVTVVPEDGFWWETGNFDSFFNATKEAMQLISKKQDNLFFHHVYTWANKSFVFSMTERGSDIVFLHASSSIPLTSISGSAFVDDNTNCDAKIQLSNVIVNSGVHVTQNRQRSILLKEIK